MKGWKVRAETIVDDMDSKDGKKEIAVKMARSRKR